eukprot:scaffold1228_cov246-Pinguiococcus_pyrenoidosus.AAC.15
MRHWTPCACVHDKQDKTRQDKRASEGMSVTISTENCHSTLFLDGSRMKKSDGSSLSTPWKGSDISCNGGQMDRQGGEVALRRPPSAHGDSSTQRSPQQLWPEQLVVRPEWEPRAE